MRSKALEVAPLVDAAIAAGGLQPLIEDARAYKQQARAANTRKAYESDWKSFDEFCVDRGLNPLPAAPGTVALYISQRAKDSKTSTIRRHLVAIGRKHVDKGLMDPTKHPELQEVWKGIRRAHGTAPEKKAPILTDGIKLLIQVIDSDQSMHPKMRARNKALLLIGFAGAFRRSELVDIQADDLTPAMEGLTIRLRKSKANQEGELELKAIPYGTKDETCPVRSLKKWMDAAGIVSGPVFRAIAKGGIVKDSPLSDKEVARILKRTVSAAGLPQEGYAGHSLRRGFITQSIRSGRNDREVMKQTGHKHVAVMRGYFEEAGIWQDNAVTHLDL